MVTWVLLAILGWGAWYFFSRSRTPAQAHIPVLTTQVDAPAADAPAASAAERKISDEDRYAQDAAAEKVKWDAERRAIEDRHREIMQPIANKIEKAQKLVKQSGVGDAACSILRDTWHWPSWSQREDWQPPIAIDSLTGAPEEWDEKQSGKVSWIGWRDVSSNYRLTLTVSPRYGGGSSTLGSLALSVDDTEVMVLDVSNGLGDEYNIWNYFGVGALKAGPWMVHINEFAGKLLIARHEASRAHELSFQGAKAAKIDI